MAKKIYVGVNSAARRVKKAYVGVNGLARRIKKAYIGIGGVARPCFSTEPEYWGETSQPLATPQGCEASSSNTYAIFGGNGDADSVASKVTAYDKSLVRSLAEDFTYGRYNHMAAGIGEYVIFAGGMSSKKYYRPVEVYNGSLTKVAAADLYDTPYNGAGAKGKNHAFIIGGYYGGTADAYDVSLTHKTFNRGLEWPNTVDIAATSLGDYVIYGGGCKGSTTTRQDEMCAVNSSLTVTNIYSLSQGRWSLAAAKAGDYALFGGGVYQESGTGKPVAPQAIVDVYNTSLTRSAATDLSAARYGLLAASVEDFAVFAGGYAKSVYYTAADVYDKSLTRSNNFTLKYSHWGGGAAEIGSFALFGGGFGTDSTKIDTVEAITI